MREEEYTSGWRTSSLEYTNASSEVEEPRNLPLLK